MTCSFSSGYWDIVGFWGRGVYFNLFVYRCLEEEDAQQNLKTNGPPFSHGIELCKIKGTLLDSVRSQPSWNAVEKIECVYLFVSRRKVIYLFHIELQTSCTRSPKTSLLEVLLIGSNPPVSGKSDGQIKDPTIKDKMIHYLSEYVTIIFIYVSKIFPFFLLLGTIVSENRPCQAPG